MDKQVPTISKQFSIPSPNDAERFIMAAIDKGVNVEVMERLLAMREKLRQEDAKAQYDTALAQFQSECPIIQKEKTVLNKDGTVRYKYAPLDSIIGQIKAQLKSNGFSYSVTAQITESGWIEATCKLTHAGGHSEISTFKVPVDKQAFMNEQQKVASALTYAKRYAFCNVAGILTGDEDDDSNTAGKSTFTDKIHNEPEGKELPATGPQVNTMRNVMTALGIKEDIAQCEKASKISGLDHTVISLDKLNKKQAHHVIDSLINEKTAKEGK